MYLRRWNLFLALALCLVLTAVTARAAEPVQEVEGNNSLEAAQLIKANEPVTETLETKGDVDYYKVTLTAPGPVRVLFQHEDLNTDLQYWRFQLLYSDGTALWSWASSGRNTSLESDPVGLPSGTYYILVSQVFSSDHTNAPYTLTAEYEPSDVWETERNGDFATADPLPVNTEVHGSLMVKDDVDYSKFEVESPGFINVSFNHPYIDNELTYWALTVYDSNRNPFYTYSIVGNVSSLETAPLGVPKGTYYVSVQHKFSSDHSSKPYGFTLNYTESSTWETESNIDFPTADPFPVNTEVHGALTTNQDVDCYKFNVDAPGAISLAFSHKHLDSSLNFWVVTLYDADRNAFYSYNAPGNNPTMEIAPVGVPVGTYYVSVAHQFKSDHSSTPYTLELKYFKSDVWEKEFNEDAASATPVLVNTEENGRLMKGADKDFYTFELASADDISLTFKHDHNDSSLIFWTITLKDQNYTDLKTYSFQGNVPEATTEALHLEAGKYYVCIGTKFNSDYLGIPYQFTVSSPNNTPAPLPEYELGDLIIRDMNGKALTAIPNDSFMVTVPITKRSNDDSALVMLAAYTAEGQLVAYKYVTVDGAPLNSTVKVTFPHDHTAGKIARVKAFVVQDFNNFQPIGEAKEFPRLA